MEFESKVKNKVLSGQAREVVANVILYMQREAFEQKPTIDFKKAQKRAAMATGVSLSTVKRIASEMNEIEIGEASSFVSPNKKRQKTATKTNIDDFDQGVLRRYIMNFCVTEKKVPTLKHIHRKFVLDNGYTGSRESLRHIMHKMGFRWRKTRTNRKLLMEKPEVQQLRTNFLRKMKRFREENRPIVYMDETYIHSTHTHAYSWNDNSNEGFHKPVSKGQRLIIVNAGGAGGFVKNAYLKFKSQTKSGDYHSEMNYTNYKKWLQEMLIPNLSPNSVLVIDNAPYHNVQTEKCPTMSSRKDAMREWLGQQNIPFTDEMLKIDLYALIKLHKPRFKTYEIDTIMEQNGHTVLRLPPYHPDLNPIELVWASLKQFVAEKNLNFNFKTVEHLCDEFFNSFSEDDWRKRCEHAEKFEKFYMEKEATLDLVVDEIIINLGEDSESDSNENDTDENCTSSSEYSES